jgi:hypothetical protein
MKICSKCGKEFPATDEYFGWNNKAKCILRAECKKCMNKHAKQRRADNKDIYAEYAKGYYRDNKEYFAEHNKQWRLDNAEYGKQYSVDHKGHKNQYYLDHKESRIEYIKQYQIDHRDAIAKYNKQYQQGHLEGCRINSHKRRARIRNLPNTLTVLEWLSTKEYFDGKCCYCGEELPLEQEHYIPVTKAGAYSKANILCACKSCNSSKNDQDALEWFKKQPFYDEVREANILGYLEFMSSVPQLSFA